MNFNLLGFFAFFLVALTLGLAGFFLYIRVTAKNFKPGDLVRTTFQACPAVLTSALFGLGGELFNSLTYGPSFDKDSVNALHCDVFGGQGSYSSWLLAGGQNFRSNPAVTDVQLYLSSVQCQSDADCVNTNIACGPGITRFPWDSSKGSRNKAVRQCPANSTCSLCNGTDCSNVASTDAVGKCVATSSVNIPLSCSQVVSTGFKYCSALLSTNTGAVPFNQFVSCSQADSYMNNPRCTDSYSSYPYWCSLVGNPQCMPGQQCVANWNSLTTGWSNDAFNTTSSYPYANNVCSGTVIPTIPIKTDWIAEGIVSSVNNDSSLNIQWQAVQNIYDGIGPSKLFFVNETEARKDFSWQYSDCRFLRYDTGRNTSVSLALLGNAQTNPRGLSYLSLSNEYYINEALFVGTDTGSLTANFASNNSPTNTIHRSAWNLQSVNVPKNNVTKIYYKTIHEFHTPPEAKGWVQEHYAQFLQST